jgi:Protein of unknown function (DUF3050)
MSTTMVGERSAQSQEQIVLMELRERLASRRAQVNRHLLYREISSLQDLRVFLESHVFAVWDFMSLLKTLQRMLTCVTVPWLPTPFPICRRLVNDIVLGEESDTFNGNYLSHFELYRQAMLKAKANVRPIDAFLEELSSGQPISRALLADGIPQESARFVETTFSIISQGKPHVVAAAFTFGREDLIAGMFRSMVSGLYQRFPGQVGTFRFYLERHIEVDGDSHGPMALKMISELCGSDATRWREAAQAAEQALDARLALWTAIRDRIRLSRNVCQAGGAGANR